MTDENVAQYRGVPPHKPTQAEPRLGIGFVMDTDAFSTPEVRNMYNKNVAVKQVIPKDTVVINVPKEANAEYHIAFLEALNLPKQDRSTSSLESNRSQEK